MPLDNRLQPVTKSKTCLKASHGPRVNISILTARKWNLANYITPNKIPAFLEFMYFLTYKY